ncbi:hypothetical protein D3C75_545460 [compost metagenome]
MPEAPAPKMIRDPQTAGCRFFKQVDEVIAAADRAELALRQYSQLVMLLLAYRLIYSPIRIIEEVMIDLLLIDPSHPKRDFAGNFIHNLRQSWLYVFGRQTGSYCFISACDIIANAGRRDLPVIHDNPADRLTIPFMMIRHQQGLNHIAGFCTSFSLSKRTAVRIAPDTYAIYILISH